MLRTYNNFLISVLLSGVVLCLVGALYVRMVRPRLIEFGILDGHEYERWLIWIKKRWDVFFVLAAQILLVTWNSILDLIVIGSNFTDALNGKVDLTAAWMPEWLQWSLQTATIMLPMVRTMILLRRRQDDE